MTEKIILPFQNKELSAIELIKKSEPEINFLRDQIVDYLIRVTQNNVAPESAEEGYIIMNAVKEFEQIADTISSQLVDKAKNWCNHDYHFSESGLSELIRYHTLTLEILIKAIKVYDNFDFKKAKSLKESYKSYRNQYFELERQHYDRLRENIEGTVSSSKTHLEIITLLRVISSHATNTSRIILYRTNHNKNKRKNDPGKPSD